jgi:hypothetical protein
VDDGLLSTAILILFFDDRGSVGLARLSLFDDGGAIAVSMFAGLSYGHAGAIWTGFNANADLIGSRVSRWCRRELRQSHSFRLLRSGMSGCDNSFQERWRVSRDLTASGARTRPTV